MIGCSLQPFERLPVLPHQGISASDKVLCVMKMGSALPLWLANGRSLGNARLNGIAVSPDASRIWVTVTGRLPGYSNREGAVLELPAFGE
jgi:hypothetical protein